MRELRREIAAAFGELNPIIARLLAEYRWAHGASLGRRVQAPRERDYTKTSPAAHAEDTRVIDYSDPTGEIAANMEHLRRELLRISTDVVADIGKLADQLASARTSIRKAMDRLDPPETFEPVIYKSPLRAGEYEESRRAQYRRHAAGEGYGET